MNADELQQKRALRQQRKKQKKRKKMIRLLMVLGVIALIVAERRNSGKSITRSIRRPLFELLLPAI